MSAPFVRAAVVLVLLLLASPAQAQGKKYALLVGVSEYDSAVFTTLKYAENDAERLATVLKDAGYDEVVVLSTSRGKKDAKVAPTAANIRAALEKLSGKVKRGDLLLVGLSGHGVLGTVLVDEKMKKERNESFFCPSDARPRTGKTLGELSKTMIPIGELFKTLDEFGAGVRLLLIDACRNEVEGETKSIDIDHLPRTKKGTAVLFSCKAGEKAFESKKLEHGVFFHHVIEGLKGEAKDKKGRVTWSRLVEHVVEKVTEDVPTLIGGGAKQTPHMIANIEGVSPLLLPLAKVGAEAEKLFREGMDAYLGLTKLIDHEQALKLFRQAAAKGHALAGGRVGWMIYFGQGTVWDKVEGLRLIAKELPAIREQADGGNPDAQTLVGGLLARSVGREEDENKAVEWCTRASEKGYAEAMYFLGLMYENGRGVDKDDKKAVEWYRKASDKGVACAMVGLAWMVAKGRGAEKDEKQAVAWYTKAAGKGSAHAMTNLGAMYANGLGVDKDEKKAVEWYKKAADKGFIVAMNTMAWVYANGRGVEKDDRKAFDWYKQSADRGSARAMHNLGWAYSTGRGVDEDNKKAVEWYRKSADRGSSGAMTSLGLMYESGRGVDKDEKKAVEWYRQAVDKGNALAMFYLGGMYADGRGVDKDEKKAVEWYKKAAEKGDTDAMYFLGGRYETGRGVAKDANEALKWYKKAAALGDTNSILTLKRLESKK